MGIRPELFASIPPESSRRLPALVRTATIFELVIEELRLQNRPTGEWMQRAEDTLSPVVEAFPPKPSRLNQSQAEMATTFARILLYRTPPSFRAADACWPESSIADGSSNERSACSMTSAGTGGDRVPMAESSA